MLLPAQRAKPKDLATGGTFEFLSRVPTSHYNSPHTITILFLLLFSLQGWRVVSDLMIICKAPIMSVDTRVASKGDLTVTNTGLAAIGMGILLTGLPDQQYQRSDDSTGLSLTVAALNVGDKPSVGTA